MKKAFLKLMLVILGLNVFTACYGPAPGWDEGEPVEATDENDSEDSDESDGKSSENGGEAAS